MTGYVKAEDRERRKATSQQAAADAQILKARAAEAFTFNPQTNVLVITLDMLQGTLVEKLFTTEPELFRHFDGFTIFSRSFSSYPFTTYSKPTIISGREAQGTGLTLLETEQDSFATDLLSKGYSVTGIDFFQTKITVNDKTINRLGTKEFIHDHLEKPDYYYNYGFALTAAIARVFGYWPKNPFVDELMDMMVLEKIAGNATMKALISQINVQPDKQPHALFFWNAIPHFPVRYTRDGQLKNMAPNEKTITEEAAYIITDISSLLQAMKDKGIYDSTLIIFMSDHGHSYLATEEHTKAIVGFEDGFTGAGNYLAASVYNTVFFIKPPYAAGPPELTRDRAWSGDARAIINFYTDNFQNMDPRELLRRIRQAYPAPLILYVNDTSKNPQVSDDFHQYVRAESLEGLRKSFAEKTIDAMPPKDPQKPLAIDETMYVDSVIIEPQGAWLKGHQSEIGIKFNAIDESAGYVLHFDLKPLNDKTGQRFEVIANGHPCGEFAIMQRGALDINIPPGVVKSEGKLYLQFFAPDAVSPKELGLFDYPEALSVYIYSLMFSPADTTEE